MIRNKICYLCTLAVVFWIAIMYIDYYTLLILKLLIALPIILLILLYVSCKLIQVDFKDDTTFEVQKDDIIPIKISIRNRGGWPVANAEIFISYRNALSDQQEKAKVLLSIPEREISEYTIELLANYCGSIHVAIEKIRFYDSLKLWKISRKINKRKEISVLPKIYDMDIQIVPRENKNPVDTTEYSKEKPGDDISEVFDLREYRDGDKLQRIHWKLSSKIDKIFVKEFSLPIDITTLIFAELSMPEICAASSKSGRSKMRRGKEKQDAIYQYFDAVIELAVSLSANLMNAKCLHYLSWYDDKNHKISKRLIVEETDMYEAIEELMEASVYYDKAGIEYYNDEYGLDNGSHLVYITCSCKEETLYNTANYRKDSKVTLVLFEDGNRKDYDTFYNICTNNGYAMISHQLGNTPTAVPRMIV